MIRKICLFAGTTEGRKLASLLSGAVDLTVCVATEYGRIALDGIDGISVLSERMDAETMERFFAENRFELIIDATHPYAEKVTENIAAAADKTLTPLMRILRESDRLVADAVYVSSAREAKDYLSNREGNILLTTGAKELAEYSGLDMQRVWARVLPFAESLAACEAAGIPAAHIIAAQGPFSCDMNLAQLKMINARYLVTKASGKSGGFEEKINAAKAAGATPLIIGAPPQTEGFSLDDAISLLETNYPIKKRTVSIIGVGPGEKDLMTAQAERALKECDAVIGAKSVAGELELSVPVYYEYLPEKVAEILKNNPSIRRAAIVMRGDTGFFSGAKRLAEKLSDYDIKILPGISSVALFAAKLGVSWDGAKLLSLHGREGSPALTVSRNSRTFILTGGENNARSVLQRLREYGMGELRASVGERLSYPDEKITIGTVGELAGKEYDALSLICVENDAPENRIRAGIPDGEFIRGSVPMTKSEIRAVSLSKLALYDDSVVWDIGAGTGSVSVECALAAFEGNVYAVEKNADAIELIRQNQRKFKTDNITVIQGTAPEALCGLPAPTHVFIGGSGGNLREIIASILQKNAEAVIVINAVTLETQSEAAVCARDFRFEEFEAVSVSVARSRAVGRYNIINALDPVWIFTMRGGKLL